LTTNAITGNSSFFASKKKVIGLIIGLVVGVLFFALPPAEGMSVEGMRCTGILLGGLAWIILDVFPNYAVMLSIFSLWAVFKVVPFTAAFASFSGSTFWLMTGAVGMGVAGLKSGLLERLALTVMKIFPATYKGQLTALVVSGIIIAPLIPSTTAKAAIIAPVALSISDSMGYKRKSRESVGLFSGFFLGYVTTWSTFLSASFVGYTVLGLFPEEIAKEFTWIQWFIAALPWSIVVLVITYIVILKTYAPKEDVKIETKQIDEKIASLGPLKLSEKITMLVLIVSLLFWMTERLHGISSALVAMVAMCVLIAVNVTNSKDFNSEIGWSNLIFIGCIVGIGGVLSATGVNAYLADVFAGFITPLMENIWLLVPVLAILTYLLRFLIVSTTTTITILAVVLFPFAQAAGIHPFVVGFILYVSVHIWLTEYQLPNFLTCQAATKGAMLDHKQFIPQGIWYVVLSLIGLFVSIPWWKFLGMC